MHQVFGVQFAIVDVLIQQDRGPWESVLLDNSRRQVLSDISLGISENRKKMCIRHPHLALISGQKRSRHGDSWKLFESSQFIDIRYTAAEQGVARGGQGGQNHPSIPSKEKI